MVVGIMQPYFFPYIGYWQLMNAVDKYVIFDDVNFINRGWINRNRILFHGQPRYFNLPLIGASQNKRINEIRVNPDKSLFDKNMRLIEEAYKKAPFFEEVYPLIKEIMRTEKETVAEFIIDSFRFLCLYLGIQTERLQSSKIEKDNTLKGQEKILNICELLGADVYINPIGGQNLYSGKAFEERGIKLKFLKTEDIIYNQFNNEFQKNLSIIDVMMFNSKERVRDMLNCYQLVRPEVSMESI